MAIGPSTRFGRIDQASGANVNGRVNTLDPL
jgi:hypothetical protein